MNKRYLVTGGLGFIGHHLVKKLSKEGQEVIVLDDFSNGDYSLRNATMLKNLPGVSILQMDIRFIDEYNPVEPIDVIIHLAARPRVQYSFDNPIETNTHNIAGTINILEFMRKHNIPKMIYASSSTAKECLSPYGIQKRTSEQYCQLYRKVHGLDIICFRFHSVYGPNMDETHNYSLLIPKLIDCAYNGDTFTLYGTGYNQRDFTYIDDVLDLVVSASQTELHTDIETIFDVGRGEPVAIVDVITLVERATNTKIHIQKGRERVEAKITNGDSERTRKFFHWEPKISLKEGIERIV